MDAYTIAVVIAAAGALGVVVWVLAKVGHALIRIAEALVAAAAVFLALWLVIRAVGWALRQTLTYWRTSLTIVAGLAWWHWWGLESLAITTTALAAILGGWRLADLRSFDAWAGRHLRAWWLRWTIYATRLPEWLYACGLGVTRDAAPVVLALTPLGRVLGRGRRPVPAELPRVLGVRSGASWDEVRVRLVPGQKPEDFDEATRALACARGVARCQVRELVPNVVSIGDPGADQHLLLVRRSISKPSELAYYVCRSSTPVPVAELVRVAGSRWAVEETFQFAKNETGLDHYQVRRYDAWYRHITLSMFAAAFLAITAHTEQLHDQKGAPPPARST